MHVSAGSKLISYCCRCRQEVIRTMVDPNPREQNGVEGSSNAKSQLSDNAPEPEKFALSDLAKSQNMPKQHFSSQLCHMTMSSYALNPSRHALPSCLRSFGTIAWECETCATANISCNASKACTAFAAQPSLPHQCHGQRTKSDTLQVEKTTCLLSSLTHA
jgi:hypothetical protein